MMTSLLPSEDRRFAPESALVLGVLLSLVLVGCNSTDNSASTDAGNSTDTSLTLPEGFRATVVAEDLGSTRHLTVAENGDVYAAVRDTENGGGIAALRDTTGDYTADRTEYFGDTGGTGIGLRDGYLYFGADTALWLATLPADGPSGGFFRDRERIPW